MTKAVQDWKIPNPTKSGFDLISKARPDKAYAAETIKKASEVARGFNNQPQQGEIDGALWEKLVQPLEKGEDIKKSVDDTIAKFNTIIKKWDNIIVRSLKCPPSTGGRFTYLDRRDFKG